MNKQEILSALADGPQEQVFHYTSAGETRYAVVLGVTTETVPPLYSWQTPRTENKVRIIGLWPSRYNGEITVHEMPEITVRPRQITYATGKSRNEWIAQRLQTMHKQADEQERRKTQAKQLQDMLASLGVAGVADNYDGKLTIRAAYWDKLVAVLTDAQIAATIRNSVTQD